jgi:hypothetical protein
LGDSGRNENAIFLSSQFAENGDIQNSEWLNLGILGAFSTINMTKIDRITRESISSFFGKTRTCHQEKTRSQIHKVISSTRETSNAM